MLWALESTRRRGGRRLQLRTTWAGEVSVLAVTARTASRIDQFCSLVARPPNSVVEHRVPSAARVPAGFSSRRVYFPLRNLDARGDHGSKPIG